MVFRGADEKNISFVEVEKAPQGKRGVIHHAADKRKVFHGGQKEVHVIGVLNEFNRGETQEGYARNGFPEAHPHRLDAKIVKEAG